MTLDDTLERPQSTAPSLFDAPSAWVTIGVCPQMASMNNYPVAMSRGGTLYVISGGDGGNTVLTSNDEGATWNPPQAGDWPVRRALSAALHDGKFYIVGGFSPGQGFGDTLVSDDCLHFSQLGDLPAPWGVRWAHTLLSAGDKLLMIAGVSGPDYSNEVWALDVEGTWTKIAEGQFTKRAWASGAALGSTLMVIGGWNDSDGAFAETLVSTDGGATWTGHPFPAGMTARHSAAAVTIGSVVYLVGGCTGRPGTTFYSDVWATRDGVTWSRLDNGFGPVGRTFAAANLGGRLGVIGSSPDIIARTASPWSAAAPTPSFGPYYPVIERLGSTLWLMNGDYNGPDKMYYSADGVGWNDVASVHVPRWEAAAGTVHNGTLWTSGGRIGLNDSRHAYVMQQGAPFYLWSLIGTMDRDWQGRYGHGMASIGGRIWLVAGGSMQTGAYYGDVWSWAQDTGWRNDVPSLFPGRCQVATCWFKDAFWVLGGRGAGGAIAEAWSTQDGTNWTQHRPPDWGPRYDFGALVIGETMYVTQGLGNGGGGAYLDTWATTDGETWSLVDVVGPPDGRGTVGAGFYDQGGRLFMIGGGHGSILAFDPPA